MDAASATRPYRSTLRERQAKETRARVVRAAGDLFSRHGFQATTLAAIGREAGVSTETVKATASKAELLIAAFETTFAGVEGARSLADAPVAQGALARDDEDVLSAVVHVIATANADGHALWTVLLGAALSDEAVAAALEQILRQRRADFAMLVAEMAGRGARIEHPARVAAELSFLFSPEGYQQLVTQSGWTRAEYTRWLHGESSRVMGIRTDSVTS